MTKREGTGRKKPRTKLVVTTDKRNDDLPVFIKWTSFLEWLLPVTEKFPKRIRFTFCDRINNLALDIIEDLVEARYTADRQACLRRANLRLEKLRVLLRLCHSLRYLDYRRYEFAMREINETGRMLGGWIKQQETSDTGEGQ